MSLNFESKRDRWNGYNPDAYKRDVIEPWKRQQEIVDEVRQGMRPEEDAVRAEDAKAGTKGDNVYSSDSD